MADLDRLREARDVMSGTWRHEAVWSVDEVKGEVIGKGADRTWAAALRPADQGWACVMRCGRMRITTTAASPWRAFELAAHYHTFLDARTGPGETLLDECMCGDPRCALASRSD